MAQVDSDATVTVGLYEYMAAMEELRAAKWARLDDGCSPFRYRTDRLDRFRLGLPVEVDMHQLPVWAVQKRLPPCGRVTVAP
jgi:hypothetical protein